MIQKKISLCDIIGCSNSVDRLPNNHQSVIIIISLLFSRFDSEVLFSYPEKQNSAIRICLPNGYFRFYCLRFVSCSALHSRMAPLLKVNIVCLLFICFLGIICCLMNVGLMENVNN